MPVVEYPDHVSEAQKVCALRFDAFSYEKSRGTVIPGAPGQALAFIIEPLIETRRFSGNQAENFAAFFLLHRALYQSGHGRQPETESLSVTYDLLFLHLYRAEPPEEFRNAAFCERWRAEFEQGAEDAAAHVRRCLKLAA
jgi:hypothetical protein